MERMTIIENAHECIATSVFVPGEWFYNPQTRTIVKYKKGMERDKELEKLFRWEENERR